MDYSASAHSDSFGNNNTPHSHTADPQANNKRQALEHNHSHSKTYTQDNLALSLWPAAVDLL